MKRRYETAAEKEAVKKARQDAVKERWKVLTTTWKAVLKTLQHPKIGEFLSDVNVNPNAIVTKDYIKKRNKEEHIITYPPSKIQLPYPIRCGIEPCKRWAAMWTYQRPTPDYAYTSVDIGDHVGHMTIYVMRASTGNNVLYTDGLTITEETSGCLGINPSQQSMWLEFRDVGTYWPAVKRVFQMSLVHNIISHYLVDFNLLFVLE